MANEAAEAAAKKLVSDYDNASPERRLVIIEALGKTGTTTAVNCLSHIINDTPSTERRLAATKALGEIGRAKEK